MRSRQFILTAIKKATIFHNYSAKDARELILNFFFSNFLKGIGWLAIKAWLAAPIPESVYLVLHVCKRTKTKTTLRIT